MKLPLINACHENEHPLSQGTIPLDYVHHLEKTSPTATFPEKSSTCLLSAIKAPVILQSQSTKQEFKYVP